MDLMEKIFVVRDEEIDVMASYPIEMKSVSQLPYNLSVFLESIANGEKRALPFSMSFERDAKTMRRKRLLHWGKPIYNWLLFSCVRHMYIEDSVHCSLLHTHPRAVRALEIEESVQWATNFNRVCTRTIISRKLF
jgi:hypothetical protein